MRLQWRNTSTTKLERVDLCARTEAAALVSCLDSDLRGISSIAEIWFPQLRELRVEITDASNTISAQLLDLVGCCGRESGNVCNDALSPHASSAARGISSTLKVVELSDSSGREKYCVTGKLLSHLSRHEGLERLHISGTLARTVIDSLFSTTVGVQKEGLSSDLAAGGIHRTFRRLRKINVSIASNAVASLMRLLAHDPPAAYAHIA